MKKFIFRKQKAVGGLTFIMSMIILVMSLTFIINLSSLDLAQSLANSAAYHEAFQTTVNLYNGNVGTNTFNGTYTAKGVSYNMSNEYYDLLKSVYGDWITATKPNVTVEWTNAGKNSKLKLHCSAFDTTWHKGIKPKDQYIVIEN